MGQNDSPTDRFLKLLPVAVALLILPPSAGADPRQVGGAILRDGHVLDFKNGWDEALDVAFSFPEHAEDGSIQGGEIVCVGKREDGCFGTLDRARYVVIDARGLLVMSGHVDTHVHLAPSASTDFDERLPYELALFNLVAAGVTTALEVGSRPEVVIDIARRRGLGYGPSLASLYTMVPGDETGFPVDPDEGLLRETLAKAREAGALGFKLTGHYPLTPEAVQRAIRVANETRSYVAVHVGFECEDGDGSCLESCRTPCEVAGGTPLEEGCRDFGSELCGLEKTLELLSGIDLDGGRPGRAHMRSLGPGIGRNGVRLGQRRALDRWRGDAGDPAGQADPPVALIRSYSSKEKRRADGPAHDLLGLERDLDPPLARIEPRLIGEVGRRGIRRQRIGQKAPQHRPPPVFEARDEDPARARARDLPARGVLDPSQAGSTEGHGA